MLAMWSSDGSLVIGLTKANVERLLAGGNPASMVLPNPREFNRFIVMYGEDKPAILAQLEAAGVEVANAHKEAAARDPI